MGSKSRKLSLIGTIFVSMLSICSAAVSTFAWFQANSNVNIQANSTSTSITVSKPDDFTFWAYKGNGNDNYSPRNPENFTADFEQIVSGSSKTSLVGMGPGQKMLFAVQFKDVTSMTMEIKSLISNDSLKQNNNTTKMKVAGTSNPETLINIGWAINIYSSDSLNGTGYTSFMSSPGTDQFKVSADEDEKSWNVSSGSYGNSTITYSSGNYKNIFTKNDSTKRADYYVFYMIEFSDDEDTYYKEVISDSASAETLDFPTANASTRWFVKDDNSSDSDGNSNCYSGLNFAISEILVTKNGEVVEQE